MRWIEWVEPFGPNDEPVYMCISESTAIATQKYIALQNKKFIYSDDAAALGDFMIVHWAKFVERNDAT